MSIAVIIQYVRPEPYIHSAFMELVVTRWHCVRGLISALIAELQPLGVLSGCCLGVSAAITLCGCIYQWNNARGAI